LDYLRSILFGDEQLPICRDPYKTYSFITFRNTKNSCDLNLVFSGFSKDLEEFCLKWQIIASALLKVVPVIGDISLPSLGLSTNEQHLLLQKVYIVIHSAATVNFNGKLKMSSERNVNSTRRLIMLCKAMKNLNAIIHVSTAYANCEQQIVQ